MSTFLSIFISINWYVIWRMLSLFDIKLNFITYFLILFAAFSYFLAALIERISHNLFTRIFYGLAGTWMGILFILFILLLIYEISHFFLEYNDKRVGIFILGLTCLLSVYALYNAFFFQVKEVRLELKNLTKPTKIIQVTDLHVGTVHNSNFLKTIIFKINTLKPDFVFITGDLIDGSGAFREETYRQLNSIQAPTYFITGNHETYTDLQKVYNVLAKTKIKVLKNEKEETALFNLIGVNYTENLNSTEEILKKIPLNQKKPTILLAHNPNIIKIASKNNIDLQLSGHTHNGQIFPFNFLVKIFYPYIQGLYQINQTWLYVSPGTGTWGPPMRLGSQNEITVINLIPKKVED